MFGYATDETEECMPLTVVLSHQLNAKIAQLRRSGEMGWARPDSKTQVSFLPGNDVYESRRKKTVKKLQSCRQKKKKNPGEGGVLIIGVYNSKHWCCMWYDREIGKVIDTTENEKSDSRVARK